MSVLKEMAEFCREQWVAYYRSAPLHHLGELVQLGDCEEIGHPWLSGYYARIMAREFVDRQWIYRVHVGHFDLPNLPIPEVFIGKV